MMEATSLADVDAAISALEKKRDDWRRVSNAERVELLERCIEQTLKAAPDWVAAGAKIKGLAPTDDLAGEEWLAGVMPTIRNARLFAEALRHDKRPPPAATRIAPDGRTVARVFPSTLMERLMFAGFSADVWMQPGKPATQGTKREGKGRVALVLGGGNVSSIPAMDVLYKLFVDDEVVLLKMNPVNEDVGPVLARAFAPLVDGGWLAIVYGGADVGAHAAAHPKIGSLHVTGSDRTYDAIVWGKNEKGPGKTRKNDKPFTAELGCVTPVLVVPGPWSDGDIRFQARHVASMVTQNASFNCNAAKVVVVAREWLQKDAFLAQVEAELAKAPPRKAYYPGAADRWARFRAEYPTARVVGAEAEGAVPWTIIPRLDGNEYALTNEAFCGVVAFVELDAPDYAGASVPRFLEAAVTFANDECWGTLSCGVLIHPRSEEENEQAFARAIRDLRYGGIGINAWPGAIYGLVSPTWGAFPGHTAEDIQSGTGVVHNAWMFDHPEKSVLRAPFRIRPTPAWFGDHRNLRELGMRLVEHEAAPSWKTLLRVARAAIKG
ncbi:MAG: aldehyde dehydrogenase [Labilithrix sp.]|nr:aldehyde dehydrogenase [Labilithrix sp.]MCW5815983.1 aldehyde dehydrogenase [Labilithrix sp.]